MKKSKDQEIEVVGLQKNKRTYTVHTSEGKHNFQEESILKFQLFTGAKFTASEWKDILKQEDKHVYFNKALNYLSYGKRSVGEIKHYLTEKQAQPSHIHFVVEKLTEIGYLDDEKLANEFVKTYQTEKLYGPKLIEQKLLLKRFSTKDIEKALKQYSKEIEEENIAQILTKEKDKLKQYPLKKQQQKLYEKVLRLGYDTNLIYQKLSTLELIDESYPKLCKDFVKARRASEAKAKSASELKQKIIQKLLSKGYEYSQILQAFIDAEE